MSSALPSAANDYTLAPDAEMSEELFQGFFTSVAVRLNDLEATAAVWDAALADKSTELAEAMFQNSVEPHVTQLQQEITVLRGDIQDAEDQLVAIKAGGVEPTNIPISDYGLFQNDRNAQEALYLLSDKFGALGELAGKDSVGTGDIAEQSVTPEKLAEATQAMFARASDARLLALHLAESRGDRLDMVDGIADAYEDDSDIEIATNSLFSIGGFSSVIEYGENLATTGQAITESGNPPARAFDGGITTATDWLSDGEGVAVTSEYLGQDFGTPVSIRRIEYTNSSYNNWGGDHGPVGSVYVEWSDDGAFWTTLDAVSLDTVRGGTSLRNLAPSNPHRYWRIRPAVAPPKFTATGPAVDQKWRVANIELYSGAYQPMTVISQAFVSGAPPVILRLAAQIVPAAEPATINTDVIASVSRDGGTTFAPVTLSAIETLSDGTTLYEGFADISGQPEGSEMVYKYETFNNKDVRISGTVMQWR